MKFVNALIIMVLSLISTQTSAKFPVGADGVLIHLPKCPVGNTHAIYIRTNKNYLSRSGTGTAMAKPAGNQPGIYYDGQKFSNFPPEFQLWVLAHECAHWQLDHIGIGKYFPGTSSAHQQERDADCYAAHTLVDKGLTETQLDLVVAEINRNEMMVIPGYNMLHPSYQANINKRAEHARQCMDDALKDRDANLY